MSVRVIKASSTFLQLKHRLQDFLLFLSPQVAWLAHALIFAAVYMTSDIYYNMSPCLTD